MRPDNYSPDYGLASESDWVERDGRWIPRWVADAEDAEELATERDLRDWYERQTA